LQHSALDGRHSTWDTRDCPHAYLAEDQAHWVLLSSGKARAGDGTSHSRR
jgi:hypothetical protein